MTKKTTEPMSLQKMFDTAAVGMLKQGKKSIDVNACRYRGSDGCKCAVGFLIPEGLYDPGIEGASVFTSMKNPASHLYKEALDTALKLREVISPLVGHDDLRQDRIELLDGLQDIHDGAKNAAGPELRGEWYRDLKAMARDFGLSTKSIDKVMKELTEASA